MSAYWEPEDAGIKGHFYCAFDPITRQIQLAVEATSVDEAWQRLAAVAHLTGIAEIEGFVVLDEAPHGVPTYLTDFFKVPIDSLRPAAPDISSATGAR